MVVEVGTNNCVFVVSASFLTEQLCKLLTTECFILFHVDKATLQELIFYFIASCNVILCSSFHSFSSSLSSFPSVRLCPYSYFVYNYLSLPYMLLQQFSS